MGWFLFVCRSNFFCISYVYFSIKFNISLQFYNNNNNFHTIVYAVTHITHLNKPNVSINDSFSSLTFAVCFILTRVSLIRSEYAVKGISFLFLLYLLMICLPISTTGLAR